MSAMFAGASRALLTSILFAIETTGQTNALLPLLAACIASYFVSFFLMENTIMTEKIARRGVRTPHTYEPDILDKITVGQIANGHGPVLQAKQAIEAVRAHLQKEPGLQSNYYIVADAQNNFKGIISSSNLFSLHHLATDTIETLIKRKPFSVTNDDTLKTAVEMMAKENLDVLPVVSGSDKKVNGILSYKDVLSAYRYRLDEHEEAVSISLSRVTRKIWLQSRKKFSAVAVKK
jgi:predicted transcriptional regulator